MRTAPVLDPPTMALFVPDAQASDFAEGTVIAVYARDERLPRTRGGVKPI